MAKQRRFTYDDSRWVENVERSRLFSPAQEVCDGFKNTPTHLGIRVLNGEMRVSRQCSSIYRNQVLLVTTGTWDKFPSFYDGESRTIFPVRNFNAYATARQYIETT